jgi:UPF0755 protein
LKRKTSCLPLVVLVGVLGLAGLLAVGFSIPSVAARTFGKPSPALGTWQKISYGLDLISNTADLTQPRDPAGAEQLFVIQPGDTVTALSERLEQAGLIRSARMFRIYLLWIGADTAIQTGTYRLSPAMPAWSIAATIKSSSSTEVTFVVLAGWRMEEIARSLATSGLGIAPDDFIRAVQHPLDTPDFLPVGMSAEGFLAPGEYVLARTTTADQLVAALIHRFAAELTPELRSGFESHGLSVFQAVTLASILQREAMFDEEFPMIASVFYNRLAADMPLQTDPTVQYALGFNLAQGTWWTNPLSLDDLKINSPYNTYLYKGLPPGPISNPSLAALQAVAAPAASQYLFFQARCDGSGLHNFAVTFEQHQQNNCP